MTEPIDYKVGKGKPPKQTQFKAGKSGNPKGRPKKNKNPSFSQIVRDVLFEKVDVNVKDQPKKMPTIEALVRLETKKGLEGDGRSTERMIKLLSAAGSVVDDSVEQEELDFITDTAVLETVHDMFGGDIDAIAAAVTQDKPNE